MFKKSIDSLIYNIIKPFVIFNAQVRVVHAVFIKKNVPLSL